jgi:hypothetical protein
MEPLNFENAAEMNCVANLTQRNSKFWFLFSKLKKKIKSTTLEPQLQLLAGWHEK